MRSFAHAVLCSVLIASPVDAASIPQLPPPHLVVGEGRTSSVALSPDGTLLLSGGARRLLRDPGTGRLMRALAAEDCLSQAVMFSPDGLLAAANCSGVPDTIRVWNVATGEVVGRHAYLRYQFKFSLSRTGHLLSVNEGTVSAVLARGEAAPVVLARGEDAEVAPDGSTFVVVQDGKLHLHDAATGARKTLSAASGQPVFSADSRFVAVRAGGGWQLVDLQTSLVTQLAIGEADVMALSAGARTLLLAVGDKERDPQLALQERVGTLNPQPLSPAISAVNFGWRQAAWSADGQRLWVAVPQGLFRVEVKTRQAQAVKLTIFRQNQGAVVTAGQHAFVNLDEGAVVGVNLTTGQVTGTYGRGGAALPVSATNKELLTLEAGRLLLWNLKGGDPRLLLKNVTVAASQGSTVVALTKNALYRFQGASWTPQKWALRQPMPYDWLSLNAGGDRLLAGYVGMEGSTTDLITLSGEQARVKLLSEVGIPARLSPDGTRAAWLQADRVELTDVTSSKVLWIAPGQTRAGRFTPDGTRLVIARYDGTVVVHDVASGRVMQTLSGNGGWADSLAFTAGGQLVTLGVEGTVRVWKLGR
ncbi:WD40 repeat domain-containing protein [Deinococcus sp. QL22]|uniref:WD40 repeat domain-containing protein n=1 Tax=Deinococcus sp. QL22 TaxID=2939437 RepID=UPI002016BA9A|nr:WD40 repeat domain-containing protein [Deinococcus sp. QL22]UQN08042.1 hypothetical protein M1R55_18290 [Deinococcus sp. QL22]